MEVQIQLDEQHINNIVSQLVTERLEALALPKVLSIDINDVKRITGIKHEKSLQKILSDPRILQHQFRLSENGPRRWNAQGFEIAYQEVMHDLRNMY
ncbi:hypothetical protein [Kurthia senegalensis]|uniref:hypothetical protein n=1 Tax=Kurthia senegalensis TaxID=1033740 RepID=UPI000289F366|nr:hypothetical protein [Kurthia senegalensis]